MAVSMASIAVWILLGIGMLAFLLTAAGLLIIKDVYERIQFTYPAATIGVVAIAAAVVVEKSISQAGVKAILTGLVLFWANPALSSATAKAARVRRLGDWKPAPDEHIEVVEAKNE